MHHRRNAFGGTYIYNAQVFINILGATIAQMTPTARDMAGNGPAVMVLGLGNPDMAEMDAGLNPYPAATQILGATFNVPCVVWINVKERGVNPYYHQQWRQVAMGLCERYAATARSDVHGELRFPACLGPGFSTRLEIHVGARKSERFALEPDASVRVVVRDE